MYVLPKLPFVLVVKSPKFHILLAVDVVVSFNKKLFPLRHWLGLLMVKPTFGFWLMEINIAADVSALQTPDKTYLLNHVFCVNELGI